MDGTLLDLLEQRVIDHGHQPLYSFLDRRLSVSTTLSFNSLYQRARCFAGVLQHHGCTGQPVIVYCPHGPEFLVAFFACIMAGAWPVPVTRQRIQAATHLSALLAATDAVTMVTTRARNNSLPQVLARARLCMLAVDDNDAHDCTYRRPRLSATDTAFIQYTSGSTAAPKGVVISHANVMHNADAICRAFGCSSDDIGVSWLPFHHDMGLIGHVIEPLYAGLHNYFVNPVDFVARPVRWLQAVSRFGATLSGGPDFAFALTTQRTVNHQLRDLSLDKWRLAYCGAEKIRPETLSGFVQRFSSCGFRQSSLYPCYGLAEATLFVSGQHGLITQNTHAAAMARPVVCLGKPAADTFVEIVNPDTGRRVANGVTGEICVSSASVACGYYRNPGASKQVFGSLAIKGRRYCRTGDQGYVKDQRLYLLGRYKNVIKRHGCSFHAEDLEASLQAGVGAQAIGRSAAFCVGGPDADRLVLLLERSRAGKNAAVASEEELIARARLAVTGDFGLTVDDIRVLPADSLPLTSSGKIRRNACSEVYRQQIGSAGRGSNANQS